MINIVQKPRSQLLPPLLAVSGVVEKNQVFPILSCILMEKAGNRLSFLSADMDIQIQTWISLEEEETGEDSKIAFPARKSIDILRAFGDSAKLSFARDDTLLLIRSDHADFRLQTLPAEDFPALFELGEPKAALSVDQKVLKQLLTKVQFSMAHQDVRYYFNGMLLSTEGDCLKAVATDGHRLGVAESEPFSGGLPSVEVILPRKTVVELLKQLSSTDGQIVEVKFYSNHVAFKFDHLELRSKLIDGKFPDYRTVIPKDYQDYADISASLFKEVLQRVAILADDKLRGIRLIIEGGRLTVTAVNNDAEQAQETLDIIGTGTALDMGLNVTYLLDVLSVMDSSELRLAYSDVKSSILMTYRDDPCYQHVIMPMRI